MTVSSRTHHTCPVLGYVFNSWKLQAASSRGPGQRLIHHPGAKDSTEHAAETQPRRAEFSRFCCDRMNPGHWDFTEGPQCLHLFGNLEVSWDKIHY